MRLLRMVIYAAQITRLTLLTNQPHLHDVVQAHVDRDVRRRLQPVDRQPAVEPARDALLGGDRAQRAVIGCLRQCVCA